MNIITDSCGAVAVFFDRKENPGLFGSGSKYLLKKFELYGNRCALVSEGDRVALLKDRGGEILSFSIPSELKEYVNAMTVKWINSEITVIADVNMRYRIDAGTEFCDT